MLNENKLRSKQLGLWTIVALAVGGTIGTWIVDMSYWFQLSGAGSFFGLILSGILVLPLALCYSELSSTLPFAGGENVWVSNAFGPIIGWIQGWLLLLLYVLAMTWVVYGLGTIATYSFPNISFSTIRLIGMLLLLIWLGISMLKVEISGKLALIMTWAMVITAFIAFTSFFASSEWHFENLTPFFPNGFKGFGTIVGILLFKYVGFDLIPQFSEEINYPLKDQWKAYVTIIAITSIVYGGAILANGGIWGCERIANATLIDPLVADELGLTFISKMIIITAFLSVVTVLPGFQGAASRCLYGMAKQHEMPLIFRKVNKFGQPWVANISVTVIAIYFTYFAPERWVEYIYTIFSFTAGVVYLLVALSFLILRKKHPDWKRPYKAPGGIICGILSVIYCAWVIYISLQEMTFQGILALSGFFAVGVIFFIYLFYKQKVEPEKYAFHCLTPEDIPQQVKERM